ncbi:zinc finger protein 106 [Festucalex cinctus]
MATFGYYHAMGNRSQAKKKKPKSYYCILCREMQMKAIMHQHMHSLGHHRELESLLGDGHYHDCQACQISSMGINQYAQHITTIQHQTNLKNLSQSKVKPISLHNTLSQDMIKGLLKRNKELKKEKKKDAQKLKKKRRLLAVKKQGREEKANETRARQKAAREKEAGQNQAGQQAPTGLQQMMRHVAGPNTSKQQVLGPQQKSNHTAVFLNKDHNQLADPHLTAKNNVSQHNSQTRDAPQQSQWSSVDHFSNYKYQSEELADFTSDQLPTHGSVIFTQDERRAQSDPKQSVIASNAQPKPAPVQDMDVSSMLREIRRALGMREPCRADREARKQSAESAPPPSEPPETLEKNAPAGGDKSGNSVTYEHNAPRPSTSIQSGQQLGAKTKVRIAHKAAAAQKSGQEGVEKECPKLSPKMTPKTPASIEPKSKKNWRVMFNESKQKRKEGMPRFGIDLATALNNKTTFDLGVDEDLMLSEGFHWESLSNAHVAPPPFLPSPPPSCIPSAPRPPGNGTTASASSGESPSTSRVPDQGASLQPGKVCGPSVASTSGKAEPESENSSANKRKHQQLQENDVPDMEAVVKRRKIKFTTDQDPMDKLLTVSLREEELSQSLQNVDKSLVLARNALQAAYTEVQRLLLLRRQCTAEVDSLRAQRIEILQSMQEVYAGKSNVEQDPTTSTAASADVIEPSPSSRSSPKVLVPPTNIHQSPEPTPSTSQPHPTLLATSPTIMMIKKEAAILPPSSELSPQVRTVPSPLPPPTAAEDPKPSNPASSLSAQQEQENKVCMKKQIESFSKKNIVSMDTKVEKVEEDLAMETVTGNDVKPLFGGDLNTSAETDVKVDENADLVEVVEPKSVVINIDESENEDSPDTPSKEPGPQEVPSNTSSAQTSQQNPLKIKTAPISVEFESEATSPQEAVKVVGDKKKEEEEEPALGAFLGHTGPVHDLQVHEGSLYTCSGDNTARAYSLVTRECQGVFEGHTNKINSLLVSSCPNMPARLYTGSSDQTVRVYSIKSKKCVETISLHDRVLCLHIAWNNLYVGLASGSVATYDVKTLKPLDMFECHGPRGVSCLGTSQEGARRVLLVGSYDSTISVRDAKNGLLLRSLEGHTKTVLCMKVVKEMVFSGSSDTSIHAHNIHTGQLMQIFKGHGHAVTSIVILGNVMVTGCLDKLVRVYELRTHDRLQVYGGHSDMVMCMAVHKSVIYTGCYDGSVQAVKLNLMKNYRCWWQNCCLIFGMTEHLVQHLVRDHTNSNLETVTCRWKGCRAFFATQQAVKEEFPDHAQTHVDVENKVES